jgi:hypothetical protein
LRIKNPECLWKNALPDWKPFGERRKTGVRGCIYFAALFNFLRTRNSQSWQSADLQSA